MYQDHVTEMTYPNIKGTADVSVWEGERDRGNESMEVGWQLSYFTVSKRSSALHHCLISSRCVCVWSWCLESTWGVHTLQPSQTITQTREDARSDKHRDVPNQRASDSQTNKLTHVFHSLISLLQLQNAPSHQFHWALKILTAFFYC